MPGVIRISIEDINTYCINRNVLCISSKYEGNKKPLMWRCLTCSFEFVSSKNNFDRYFKHCKNCYYNNSEINSNTEKLQKSHQPKHFHKHISQLNEIIKDMGAELLSNYNGSDKKVSIRCNNGHVFSSKFCNIVNIGTWCPICADKKISISENIVRKYFEVIFNDSFPKVRPDWLKNNESGYNLELDGFCEKLSIAFEHQGPHHYNDTFKNGRLNKIIKLDNLKKELCNKNNIKLFIVPHLFKKTKIKDLFDVIQNQANDFGLSVSEPKKINILDCYYDSRILELENIAISRGGILLDKEYYGMNNKKVMWQCKNGHIWSQFPYSIKRGSWCPVCVGYKKGTVRGCNVIKE